MNDLDEKIKSILHQRLDIPEEYDNMIINTLNNLPEKDSLPTIRRNKFKLSFAAVCCTIFLTTSIVFANDIGEFVKNIFNYNNGIDKAVQNGYIDNPNVETIKSNGTTITAKNFLMDDCNLSFNFNINVENNDINSTEFLDMIITDEDNNILYCEDKNAFNKYCQEHNLNYEYGKYNEKYLSIVYEWKAKKRPENNINMIYNISTDKFPKSKKLFINVSQMKCKKENDEKEIILNGDWNIELNVPEKFYNRECAVYTVTNCNDSRIDVTNIAVYNTGTKFEFVANFDSVYNEDDSEDVKQQKINDFYSWYSNNIKKDIKLINNEYIEDENGNKFYAIGSTTEDKAINYEKDGKFSYSQVFDFIKYEESNKLKIAFNLNLFNENKDIVIELERKS